MKTKITAVVLIIVMLCAMCCIMSACPKKDEKYDVTMKVVCREVVNEDPTGPILEEWIFTPDIETLYTEREYDGKRYAYYLYQYNLPNHPNWSENWFTPNREGQYWFPRELQKKVDGQFKEEAVPYRLSEKGEYRYYVSTNYGSSQLKFRSIFLYITIK